MEPIEPSGYVLVRLYVDEAMGIQQIAERFGVGYNRARQWLIDAGIPLRLRGPPTFVRVPENRSDIMPGINLNMRARRTNAILMLRERHDSLDVGPDRIVAATEARIALLEAEAKRITAEMYGEIGRLKELLTAVLDGA